MEYRQKKIAIITLIIMMLNLASPIVLGTETNLAKQDSSTNEDNVEFDARLANISDDGTIEGGEYSKTFDLYKGGILQITINVKDTGYLKNGTIKFSNNNYIINDFSHVKVTKNSAKNESTKIENLLNETNDASNEESNILNETETISDFNTNINVEGAKTLDDSSLSQALEEASSFDYDNSNGDAPIPVNKIEEQNTNSSITNTKADINDNNVIKNVSSDGIELNEINSNRTVTITLPISFQKGDYVQQNTFDTDSNIEFTGTYINIKGKEKNVSKKLTVHVSWSADVEGEIGQEVLRCLRYNENQLLLSMRLTNRVKDNKLPYITKEVDVNIPQIGDISPTKAIVTGKNISYNLEDNVLKIKKDNDKNSNGDLQWASDDVFIITYIYTIDELPANTNVSSDVTTSLTLPTNQMIQGKLENTSYNLVEAKGNIVDLTLSGPMELSKGLMYTNLVRGDDKYDTTFNEVATINVGYTELIDRFELSQENKNKYIVTRKVTVKDDELKSILGEDGYIEVINESNETIGTLNKDNLSVDISDTSNLRFVSSKPQNEGNISIIFNKAIPGDFPQKDIYSITAISRFNDKLLISGIYQDQTISANELNLQIKLTEPESNAKIDISKSNLSTTELNNDVEITATLETNSISDMLYKDPVLKISLPDDVEEINVKDAKLIFDDELVPESYDSKGNVITVKLSGNQTKYCTQDVSEGSIIKILADIKLNELAYSKESSIKLDYSNAFSGENKSTETSVNIVAPEQFILTNELKLDSGEDVIAKENGVQSIKIKGRSIESHKAKVAQNIVNNLGKDASGVSILGRIISDDMTYPDGTENVMSSDFKTTLESTISVNGIPDNDYSIYYSDNGKATNDINDSNNGWTSKYSNETKSYLIVLDAPLPLGNHIQISYSLKIPSDIDYEKTSAETYAIYYLEGDNQANKMSNACEIITYTKPYIDTSITAINVDKKEELFQDSGVQKNDIIQYQVAVKNNSNGTAENVVAKFNFDEQDDSGKVVPSYSSVFLSQTFVETRNTSENDYYYSSGWMKPNIYQPKEQGTLFSKDGDNQANYFEINVGSLSAKETRTYTLYAAVNSIKDDTTFRASINADEMDAPSENSFKLKINEPKTNIILSKKTDGNSFLPNSEINCNILIDNQTANKVSNLNLIANLPKGISFESGDGFEYNKKKKILTFNKTNVDSYDIEKIPLTLKVDEDSESENKIVKFDATYDYDNNKVSSSSNELTIQVKSFDEFSGLFTSDKGNGKLLDRDILEYYVSFKNTEDSTQKISIEDDVPEELNILSVTAQKGDSQEEVAAYGNKVIYNTEISNDEIFQMTIRTKPKYVEEQTTITNSPIMKINGTDAKIAPEEHTIVPSVTGTTGENNNGGDSVISNQKNSILGSVWDDTNRNGKKDLDESPVSNIELTLYNKNNNKVVTDSDGVEVKATSNEDGKYELNNIPKGNYYLVAKYDTNKYKITQYQAKDVNEYQNSDFIDASMKETRVATSNIITLDNKNAYNVDLGLDSSQRFDLSLDMNITNITVTNPNKKTESDSYENKLLKHEFDGNDVNNDTALIEYTIVVKNEGNVDGFASMIIDYLPDELEFDSQLNPDWYQNDEKNIFTTSLADQIIKSGESKSIKLILTKKMNGESVGLVHNVAEIYRSYNSLAEKDSDSIPGNKKDGEDDISYSDIFLGVMTGGQIVGRILIYAVGILLCASAVIYVIKTINIQRSKKINKWKGDGIKKSEEKTKKKTKNAKSKKKKQ